MTFHALFALKYYRVSREINVMKLFKTDLNCLLLLSDKFLIQEGRWLKNLIHEVVESVKGN